MSSSDFYLTASKDVNLFAQEWDHVVQSRGVVCLVHGLGEHSGRYAHVAEYFNAHHFTVLTFDLRGHGKSSGQRGHVDSYDLYLDDLDLLLQEAVKRHPNLPILLYGHSLGGNIVLYYAIKRKPEIAGVVSTSPVIAPAVDPGIKLLIGKALYSLVPRFSMTNGLDRSGLSRISEVVEKYNQDPLVHPMISARLGLDMINSGKWLLDHAEEFPLPLLLLQGTADRLVSLSGTREFASKVPTNCVLYKEWEDAYHELHNDLIKQDVMRFISTWIETQIS